MKFKLHNLALALPASLMAVSVHANLTAHAEQGMQATHATTAVKQSIKKKAAESLFGNKYFVLLEDEPVSLYQGGISGLKATNVMASGNTNVNANGKLNLQSNASVAYRHYLSAKQTESFTQLQSTLKRDVKLHAQHQVALNALVVELEEHEAMALRKMPGVLAVQKDSFKQLHTDVGPTHVGAPVIWDNEQLAGTSMGEGLVIGVIDTGIASYKKKFYPWSSEPTEADFNPSFADIGGDGYDHTNPYGDGVYFGDCVDQPFWCNDKLVGVVSFDGRKVVTVSSSDLRFNTGQDDQGHGSHVASTAAGNVVNDVPYLVTQLVDPNGYNPWEQATATFTTNISGVAPHANIISYRTCIPQWGCSDSSAIQAIEHAIENNVDVLNYSVGGAAESPWYAADALAFLSAREAGIHVAISAGNSGPGPQTVGSPGNSPWVTTVAALTHGRDYTDEKTASFTGGASALPDMVGKGITTSLETPTEIVYAGDIESEYYQQQQGGEGYCYASAYGSGSLPRSYSADNVVGKVVVCRRGGSYNDVSLSRLNKSIAANYAGAAGLILINSDENLDSVVGDMHEIPTVHLNKADGDALLAWLETGEDHKVSILGESEFVNNLDKADIAANFTSRGPDLVHGDYLVPDIGAPGVDIYASNIGSGMHSNALDPIQKMPGDYIHMSGTSMSSPHIAGMYLLMKAAQPDWTPAQAQSALMMTASTQVWEREYQFDEDGEVLRDESGAAIFELVRANHHVSGNGSARVDRAINAGLVLDESKQGYLAGNPLAQVWEQAEIEGWHGEPHQLNMPSLSKKNCLIECSWTRTFDAVKGGDYTVSFEYLNEGFTLTSDKSSFSVSEGEQLELTINAVANQALAQEWVDAKVVLTPSDGSLPTLTLPVTVNFIAGIVPENFDVDSHRDHDSAPVKGIVTIGTDNLQQSKSGLAKADVYEFSLRRDDTNSSIMPNLMTLDDTVMAIPLNIQADSKRLVVEVLETTSPDLDLFVGIDVDLSGDPTGSPRELDYIRYMSAGPTSAESIDVLEPINDSYWILVHNWAEGPAPLQDHQMVCDEGQQADEGMECAPAPVMDTVKISVTNLAYDEDNLMVETPDSVEAREEVETRVRWAQEMEEGDIYHGVFWLGTTEELPRNIGAIRVNLNRGMDDVRVSSPMIDGDDISTQIKLVANNSGEDRAYQFEMSLSDGVDVVSLHQGATQAAMSMAMEEAEYELTENGIRWQFTQPDGASAVEFSLMVNSSNVVGMADVTPVVDNTVSSSDVTETVAPADGTPVFIYGRPSFDVRASAPTVKKGETVTLTASVVDAVIEEPEISYNWRQVAGPQVAVTGTGSSQITFEAPKVKSDTLVSFEMVGSNGEKQSFANRVDVEVTKHKSGGSTHWYLLSLLAGVFALRRTSAKRR